MLLSLIEAELPLKVALSGCSLLTKLWINVRGHFLLLLLIDKVSPLPFTLLTSLSSAVIESPPHERFAELRQSYCVDSGILTHETEPSIWLQQILLEWKEGRSRRCLFLTATLTRRGKRFALLCLSMARGNIKYLCESNVKYLPSHQFSLFNTAESLTQLNQLS